MFVAQGYSLCCCTGLFIMLLHRAIHCVVAQGYSLCCCTGLFIMLLHRAIHNVCCTGLFIMFVAQGYS